MSQSKISNGKPVKPLLAKNVTVVASFSVPVFDAVSITANTPSQCLGYRKELDAMERRDTGLRLVYAHP
jgi:hypothetical protein